MRIASKIALSFSNGVEGMKQYNSCDRRALPEVCFTIEEQIAEGNAIVTRFTWENLQG
jgi:predicted ester cyclase